jgi:hypothetical protein
VVVLGGWSMPIRGLLEGASGVFEPEDIQAIVAAFDDILADLQFTNRDDPAVTMIAKLTIEFASRGERDPVRLRHAIVQSLKQL